GLIVGLISVADASQHQGARSGQREITGRVGAPEMVLRGPVVSVSPDVGFLVMRMGSGRDAEEIPVEIDARTTLTRAGRSASITDVQPGDRVVVRYSGSPGDVSKTVEVAPGRATRPARAGQRGM